MLQTYFLVKMMYIIMSAWLRKLYATHFELDHRRASDMSAMDTDEASVVLSSNTASGLSVSL